MIQPTDCLDGRDISSEVIDGGDISDIYSSEVEDVTAALSGLAIASPRALVHNGMATIFAAPHLPSVQETDRLLARPGPGHAPGVVSPGKKRYHVVVVGKCAGLYYDVW
jgi:hypothetical protein